VIDAKRREVFVRHGRESSRCRRLAFEAPGRVCVGDGAVRYRAHLEGTGATVARRQRAAHSAARFHALLARDFGSGELVEPVYIRAPDADRMLA